MKPERVIAAILLLASNAGSFAQAVTAPASPGDVAASGTKSKSPQDLEPGLIARAYLSHDRDQKKFPSHLVAVVQTGKEFQERYQPMAVAELRGVASPDGIHYVAFGYIVVNKDTEVAFDVGDGAVTVNGKDFGEGSFRHPFKKGKYPIEITRRYGKSQPGFSITDPSTGQSVLFHTGEMLSRELNRSIKVERKTFKTKLLGDAPAQSKP